MCIHLRLVSLLFTVLGVFAKKVIQKRTQFGPYVGKLSTKLTHYDDSRLVLQVTNSGWAGSRRICFMGLQGITREL